MSGPLLLVVGAIYLGVAADYSIMNGRPWLAFAFVSYALANVGFFMDAR